MEGWYDEWKRKFLKRMRRESKKAGTSIEGLEECVRTSGRLPTPAKPARREDVVAEAKKPRLRLTRKDVKRLCQK
jgi:hypothetical protein